MIIALVILTIAVFLLVDFVARTAIKRLQDRKIQKKRLEALDIGLKLDYTDEAVSLKKVQVENPKAKILAVDDEAVILDSFRRILVIAGYSVDTVESGKEAIGLIRKNDYDFVFTDLKMPEMDGVDVVKAVKHLRPDIDVIMITGYATIESAVEVMKFGAMDYVQKPFTAEELTDFVDKSLIRRQDRIERQIMPSVHLVTPSVGVSTSRHEFNVPSGIFVSPTHTWVNIYPNGMLLVGLDDFIQKLIGSIDRIELPAIGSRVRKGDPLFSVRQGDHELRFASPASGEITTVNNDVAGVPDLINRKPFEAGWVCGLDPSDLTEDVKSLRLGADATAWYEEEIKRFTSKVREMTGTAEDQASDAPMANGELEARKEAVKWDVFAELQYADVAVRS